MSEDNPPLDDAGIVIDQILEVCASIVSETHNRMLEAEKNSPRELRDMAMTMDIVWNLSREIIENDFLTNGDIDFGDGTDMDDYPDGPRHGPSTFDD